LRQLRFPPRQLPDALFYKNRRAKNSAGRFGICAYPTFASIGSRPRELPIARRPAQPRAQAGRFQFRIGKRKTGFRKSRSLQGAGAASLPERRKRKKKAPETGASRR